MEKSARDDLMFYLLYKCYYEVERNVYLHVQVTCHQLNSIRKPIFTINFMICILSLGEKSQSTWLYCQFNGILCQCYFYKYLFVYFIRLYFHFYGYSIKFNAIWWDYWHYGAWKEFSNSVHFYNCDQSIGGFNELHPLNSPCI